MNELSPLGLGIALLIMLFGFDMLTQGSNAWMRGYTRRVLRWALGHLQRAAMRLLRWVGRELRTFVRWLGRHAWRYIRQFSAWAWRRHPEAVIACGVIMIIAALVFSTGHLP